jgi:hypothetical protein
MQLQSLPPQEAAPIKADVTWMATRAIALAFLILLAVMASRGGGLTTMVRWQAEKR